MHFNASFISPFIDLFISILGKWGVINVVIQRFYLLLLFNALKHINIVSIEIVQLSSKWFDLFRKLIKSSDHKLDAIMWKIGISLRFDLLWRKNENRGYLSMLDCLQNQRGIIVKTKVSMEKEYIHYFCLMLFGLIYIVYRPEYYKYAVYPYLAYYEEI